MDNFANSPVVDASSPRRVTRPDRQLAAFVLSGGGSLWAVQVGLLRALLEADISLDLVVGTSTGALNGPFLVGHLDLVDIAALEKLWHLIHRLDVFRISPRHLMRGTFGSQNHLFSQLGMRSLNVRADLGFSRLEEAAIPIRVVTTDLFSGDPVVLSEGDTIEALVANAAAPGVFSPVEIGGWTLADGGVVANLPIRQALELGATRVSVLPAIFDGLTSVPRCALDMMQHSTMIATAVLALGELEQASESGDVHVLPLPAYEVPSMFDFDGTSALIESAYASGAAWLRDQAGDAHLQGPPSAPESVGEPCRTVTDRLCTIPRPAGPETLGPNSRRQWHEAIPGRYLRSDRMASGMELPPQGHKGPCSAMARIRVGGSLCAVPHCWRRQQWCRPDLLLQTRHVSRHGQGPSTADPIRLSKPLEGSAVRGIARLGSQARVMTCLTRPPRQGRVGIHSERPGLKPRRDSVLVVAASSRPADVAVALTASVMTPPSAPDTASIDTPWPARRSSHYAWAVKYVLPLAGVALIGVLGLWQRHLLGQSASALRTLHWAWIALALACEAGSMTTFGLAQRRLLKVGGIRIGVRSVTAIALVGKAISSSLPLAGAEMGTAYTYRRFQHHQADGVTAAWVLTVSGVASSVSFAVIVSAAAIATADLGAIFAGLTTTILTLLAVAVAVVAIRRPVLRARIERAAVRAIRLGQRIVRRPPSQTDEVVKAAIARLSTLRINRRDATYVGLASSANWIGDILCLAFAVAAIGKSLPWPDVVLGWAAGSAAGSLQLTPGGLGMVEAALTSALVVTGLQPGDAAAVALTYRAMSYWAPTLTGWAVFGARHHAPSASPPPTSTSGTLSNDRD
jgi:uncharacterized protein (TIRG00374 family)